jgi:pimeloyl-ACP methyl ester carboxylesterase
VAAFYRIAKRPHDPFTKDFLSRCQSHTVKVNGKFYKYFERGSGPTVLHVHGVHGNLGSMVGIAEALVEQNYRVVLFDAPAHGEALGTSTDPVEVRGMIRGLCDRLGDLHATICHSLGGLWALSAWSSEVSVRAFVSISAPTGKRFLVEKFTEFNKLDSGQVQGLVQEIEARFGAGVWTEFSLPETVRAIDVPGLIIHGANDDFVPPEHAEVLHANWRRSDLEMVDGVGHFDITNSPAVRQSIVSYLRAVK